MDLEKIGAQLYTVREFTQKVPDIADTMEKIGEMGYPAVQLSGLRSIGAERLKEILDENDLEVAATHRGVKELKENFEEIVKNHKLWNCEHIAVSYLPEEYRTEEGYYNFAEELTRLGRKFSDKGIELSYHNHSFEFEKFGEKTGFEILCEETNPEYVNFELDTYWVQHGGGDPAGWIEKLSGRTPLLHLKDMAMRRDDDTLSQAFAEVGEGNLNW
ncbi:xylose isomerase, partial [candidate division MSBL1 archaeon SCGC-AAA259O05]